jgi:DNA (cytosine-5)-methyltransferase 1
MATFLDLFAGCGGFSIGLKQSGLTSVGEVEFDEWAADSLRQNFPDSRVLQSDVRDIDDSVIRSFSGVDVIVGGPPCQGFSVAGTTQFGVADPRNELVYWFLHWVCILAPRIAVIENVPNILTKSKDGATVLDVVQKQLQPLGYLVTAKVLNAADFGTPQLRRRAFIVATAPGIKFNFPNATHTQTRVGGDLFKALQTYTTVGDAISDLPPLDAGEGVDSAVPYSAAAANSYQEIMRRDNDAVTNHVAMKHTDRLIERFKKIRPGQSLKDVALEHGQIAKFTGETVKSPFKYNNYRLDKTKPSLAIPASFQSLFLHPSKHRNLTAREAARLMGFPDSFEFKGKRTTMSWEKNLSQYNQIGNAVCPLVASALGRSINQALQNDAGRTPSISTLRGISSITAKLTQNTPLPIIEPIVRTEIEAELTKIGQALLGRSGPTFTRQGFSIPTAALPAALIFASERLCPVCSPALAPFCSHSDEMAFLISKDDVQSLRENGHDHGLDYHLRVAFGIPHQVGHLVGEQLAEIGMVNLVMLINVRTGRRIRGMQLKGKELVAESVAKRFRQTLTAEYGYQLKSA